MFGWETKPFRNQTFSDAEAFSCCLGGLNKNYSLSCRPVFCVVYIVKYTLLDIVLVVVCCCCCYKQINTVHVHKRMSIRISSIRTFSSSQTTLPFLLVCRNNFNWTSKTTNNLQLPLLILLFGSFTSKPFTIVTVK